MTKEKFIIRTYGKSEYAMMLFPNIDDPKQAQDKLLRWIKRDKKFHEKLLSLSITPNDNHYNPQQIRELVLKFGAPGEYEF